MKKLVTLLFAVASVTSLQAQTTIEWMVLSVIAGPGHDQVRSVAVGSEFAVFAATSDGGLKTGDDIVYGVCNPKTGAVSRTRYAGPGSDRAVAVFLDEDGNGIVVGNSQGNGTGIDVVIIKFDKSGNPIWESRFDSPAHEDDVANDVVMDPKGNILIGGFKHDTESNNDWFVAKYSPSG